MNGNKDITTTLAGGASGLLMLEQVKWEAVPHGELVKIFVAFALMGLGYLLFKGCKQEPPKSA